ncbi:MAG: hypothetical protein CL608_05575 [Anaerolineaceae bacterium]|nr:hypothetical protein [Anaerolineaceae bacterium]
MNKFSFRDFFDFILDPETLIAIVGIVIAGYIAFTGITTNNTQQALTAILVIVGTSAISQIFSNLSKAKTNKSIDRINNVINEFKKTSSPQLRKRSEMQSLSVRGKHAEDILIIAQTAFSVLTMNDFLLERLQKGATIRIAVANIHNESILSSMVPLTTTTREGVLADMNSTLARIKRLREKLPTDFNFSEGFQIRSFDYVPTLSLAMIDGHKPNGQIVAEIVPYQIMASSRPHLFIKASEDPEWYAYFHRLCENIWEESSPLQI